MDKQIKLIGPGQYIEENFGTAKFCEILMAQDAEKMLALMESYAQHVVNKISLTVCKRCDGTGRIPTRSGLKLHCECCGGSGALKK